MTAAEDPSGLVTSDGYASAIVGKICGREKSTIAYAKLTRQGAQLEVKARGSMLSRIEAGRYALLCLEYTTEEAVLLGTVLEGPPIFDDGEFDEE